MKQPNFINSIDRLEIKMNSFAIQGQIVDMFAERTFPGELVVKDGIIESINEIPEAPERYIMPGLIDSHIHIESSMLAPSQFAVPAIEKGVCASVSDPHEIANALGLDGVKFMIDDAAKVPFKFNFGAPSCVPATDFESSGAKLSPDDIEKLLDMPEIKYLSEMMNFPGVIFDNPDIHMMLKAAKDRNKPIDGHIPGIKGEDLKKYVHSGISTDHECSTLEEAVEKIDLGMKILIREGSAAKNFEALHSLIDTHTDMTMLCSDDKHPDDLIKSHIDGLVKRALKLGHSIYKILRCAVLNPIEHYKINSGAMRIGDPADIIVVENLKSFKISKVYIDGELVAKNGKAIFVSPRPQTINNFQADRVLKNDLKIKAEKQNIRVIEVIDTQLITNEVIYPAKIIDGYAVSDTEKDVLKICVLNRYQEGSRPAVAFIKNIGLKKGAIATSVAHDSHNIIAVGCDDESIAKAMNQIIEYKGGLCVVSGNDIISLSLPIAGLMSPEDAEYVAEQYSKIEKKAKSLGSKLIAPFMTLSFMALLVIPKLKLSDKGLFDGEKFAFTELFID
jgi:adenine deaminase